MGGGVSSTFCISNAIFPLYLCPFSASVLHVLRRQRRHPGPAGLSPVCRTFLICYCMYSSLSCSWLPAASCILIHICNDRPPLAYMLFNLSFPPSVLSACSAGSLRRADQRGAGRYGHLPARLCFPSMVRPCCEDLTHVRPCCSSTYFMDLHPQEKRLDPFSDPGAPLPAYLFLSPWLFSDVYRCATCCRLLFPFLIMHAACT